MTLSRQSQSARSRPAMTLVELMVAVALSSALLAALVGVLRGIGTQAKLADQMDQPVWPSRFVNLLRRDLIAAEAIWAQSGVVWMRTDAPRYQQNDASEQSSSGIRRIGYRCDQMRDGQFVLQRIDQGQAVVLAIGPTRLVVERLDRSGEPQPLPPLPGPVPIQVRVWVWTQETERPIVLSDLVVR